MLHSLAAGPAPRIAIYGWITMSLAASTSIRNSSYDTAPSCTPDIYIQSVVQDHSTHILQSFCWLVLALVWPVGLLPLGLLAWWFRARME